jgi:hypothetical protein
MRWPKIQLLIFAAVCICLAKADELEIPDDFDLDEFDDTDEELLRLLEEKHVNKDLAHENEHAMQIAAELAAEQLNNNLVAVDPCLKIHCGAGRVCKAEGTSASCVCIPECPEENDPRRKVCTNKNETWTSDCEVYRHRCLCDSDDPQCRGPEFAHMHIDYYGECKDMPDCQEDEMNDFPRRMREWLFNVMRDLSNRDELAEKFVSLEVEAETNLTRRWANAAVWKWCDLDGHPHDRTVSRHELFPIRAPLMALEHCIAPFLETCDPDNNHRITLKEWGKCLELDEADMLENCDKLVKDKAHQ